MIGNFFNESNSMRVYSNYIYTYLKKLNLKIELFEPRGSAHLISKFYYKYFYFPLLIIIKSKDKNIIHITDQSYAFLIQYLRIVNNRTKILVTCHDIIAFYYKEDVYKRSIFGSLSYFLWRWSIHSMCKADFIFSDSLYTKEKIIQYLNIDPAKVMVVYLGYNVFKMQKPTDLVVNKFNKIKTKKRLLSVGTNETRKNLISLLHLLKHLNSDSNDFVLVRVGEWLTKEQLLLLDKLGQSQNVIQLGKLSDDDLKFVYTSCHVFLFPSFEEGFGLPCLEAMYLGIPVVASLFSSIPEVVGDAGILLNPNNTEFFSSSIKEIIENDQKRSKIIRAGFERVKMFSWEKTVNEILKAYKQCAG